MQQVKYVPIGTHAVAAIDGATIGSLSTAPAGAAIPASAVSALASLGGTHGIGDIDTSKARLLLGENRPWGGSIYAAPNSTGGACYYVMGGPASCVAEFNQAAPVAFAKFDRDGPGGDPVTVVGLAPDDVTAIDVEVGGTTYTAQLANNAFFFAVPSGTSAPVVGLTIHYGDGGTLQQPLAPLRSEGSRGRLRVARGGSVRPPLAAFTHPSPDNRPQTCGAR